ncbi:carbohydrate kinase [Gluconobacter frateurii]|uniref:FGGY-family carbohydrate kinase n=1 Tax=Gluconobacter frateurii TaxID=38308 RepID=UPI001F054E52|nr:FGGY-family carbohydrate kinase [Gluconobacter frateurii]UMM07690.1 carbohydrate kinase [Gluconobacter frateurii]
MRQDFTIGIDCGSTTTKAVVFSRTGEIVGVGRRRVPQHMNEPRHVERDMHEAWRAVIEAVREALESSGVDPRAIAGVGVTAHGDGLFVLDRSSRPLGRGIMSLDSRAAELHEEWKQEGRLEKIVPIAGQRPYPYSANTLLAWMKRYQPERYGAIGTVFFAKDWIRLCLTGEIATDLTEASTSFTDLYTQDYSDSILDVLDIREIRNALPQMRLSCDRGGVITRDAAVATGLLEGTPVSVGLHDVTAAAVGLGYTQPGDLSITAGTFSINEIFRSRPVIGDGWACRAGYRRGLWNCMAISPASSSNLEWLARLLLPEEKEAAQILAGEVDARLGRSRAERAVPLYHPFLFGSPYEAPASASLFGVQSWHDRADLFQAMIEGTIFNHREHVETLRLTGAVRRLGVSGGGSGQPSIAQMFADILNMPVEISTVREAGALGAALTASVAVGLHDSLEDAVAAQDIPMTVYQPEPARTRVYEGIYQRYVALTQAMQPFWSGLYEGAAEGQETEASNQAPVPNFIVAAEMTQEIRP